MVLKKMTLLHKNFQNKDDMTTYMPFYTNILTLFFSQNFFEDQVYC